MMKKKFVGTLVCMLLITAAVLSATGIMINSSSNVADSYIDHKTLLDNEISEPAEPAPEPAVTKTGYLSIPAAAFNPKYNDVYYKNSGYHVTGQAYFVAPVYLPHGVTVKKMTYYWVNEVPASAWLFLSRNYMDGTTEDMANAWIDGGVTGNGNDTTDKIDYPEIDNSLYSYYLELCLDVGMGCYGVIIEYNYKCGSSSQDITEGEYSLVPNICNR